MVPKEPLNNLLRSAIKRPWAHRCVAFLANSPLLAAKGALRCIPIRSPQFRRRLIRGSLTGQMYFNESARSAKVVHLEFHIRQPLPITPTLRFAGTALAALLVWLAADLVRVSLGSVAGRSAVFDYAFFPAVYAGFLWATLPLFPHLTAGSRWFLRAWAALGAFVTWIWPAAVVVFYFHHWIGGTK